MYSFRTDPHARLHLLVSVDDLLHQEMLRNRRRPHERARPKDRLTDLCLSMANLLASRGPDAPVLQPQTLPYRPQHRQLDIVEISDDSEPPTPPRSSLRKPISNLRRPAMVDSDSDDDNYYSFDSGSESADSLPVLARARDPDHRRKRAKLRHSPSLHAPRLPLLTRPNVISPEEEVFRNNARIATPVDGPRQSSGLPTDHVANKSFHSMNASLGADNTFDTPQPAPYYYDTRLDAEMYRGPGFEHFPVVLGTVEGHRELCQKWKGKGTKILQHAPNLCEGIVGQPDEDEARCLQRVQQVFPDIEVDFALRKIRDPITQLGLNDEEIDEHTLPTRIISQILEMEDYPKEAPTPITDPQKSADLDVTGVTVPWDKNIRKNGSYLKEAVILLATQFDHVPTHYIYKTVHERNGIFDSYIHLQEVESDYYTRSRRPYIRCRQPRANLEKKYARSPREQRNQEQHAQIVNELQAAKQHVAREALKLSKQKEKDEAEATNLAIHKASGSLIECQCCFDDEIPMNRSVSCEAERDIHFFCYRCVAQLAETQVGIMKHEMQCMDGSGCKAALSQEGVGRAVPIKTFDRLAFNQQQAEITAARIEGLEQCPFCDFKGICDPIEQDCVFNCQNPDCRRTTCRKCKENAHVPKSCEEAKAERGLSARHRIEEARTESVLRPCPKCSVKIIKELGCNKMTCTTCGCIMCYVCKADISKGREGGYEHFNKPGAKCKLYDEQGIDRHEVEADQAEKEAIKKAKAEDAELDEKQLQIETGPGQKKPKTNPPPGLPNLHHVLGPAFGFGAANRDAQGGLAQQVQLLHQQQAHRQQQQLQAQLNGLRRVHRDHLAEERRRVNDAQRRLQAAAREVAAARQERGFPTAPALPVQQQPQLPYLGQVIGGNNGNNMAFAAANHALANEQPPPYLPGPQWGMGYPNYYAPPGFGLPQLAQQVPPAAGLNQDLDDFMDFGIPLEPFELFGPNDMEAIYANGYGNDAEIANGNFIGLQQ